MCIGVPMQIVEVPENESGLFPGGEYAFCRVEGEGGTGVEIEPQAPLYRVDLSLVGAQPPGTWVLVFLGAAREVLDPRQAARVGEALRALGAAARGESLEGFFADLTDREPQLPDFLKPDLQPQEKPS